MITTVDIYNDKMKKEYLNVEKLHRYFVKVSNKLLYLYTFAKKRNRKYNRTIVQI